MYYHANQPNILAACPLEMQSSVRLLPVEARLCENCGLGFNSVKLSDVDLKFIYDNYCYISPLQGIGCSKYSGMIATLKKFCKKTDKIVEIGCSEGYLLNLLQQDGYRNLIGIEPGPQAATAETMGISVIRDYYTESTFLKNDVDVFFLMHVFEHFSDPFTILDTMIGQLNNGGRIIIEVPDFDGYCHQHLFYYNVPFFKQLCRDKNLKIAELTQEMAAIRLVLVRENDPSFQGIEIAEDKKDILERALHIQSRFQENTNDAESILSQNTGMTVYWWGAGSASVILLNQIDSDILKKVNLVIIDGDPSKVGTIIPGLNIPVHSADILQGRHIETLIIASSFFREIEDEIQRRGFNVRTIRVLYS